MAKATTTAAAPVVLVCGDDDFTVKQRAKKVYDAWCTELGGMDHEVVDGTAMNSSEALQKLGRLNEALNTLPFFGGAKVVWFQNCTFLGEDRTGGSAAVTGALADMAETLKNFRWDGVRLLISSGKPDKRRVFYKTLEKMGTVENFSALSQDDKDWAVKVESDALRLLREAGREIDDAALSDLVSRTGPNLRLMASEVEKLILYTEGRPAIGSADVAKIVSRQKHARAFALSEALGDRDLPKLLKVLDEELWEIRTGADKKKSEIGLLYGLISKIRTLLLLQELMRLGVLKPARDYNAFKAQLERVPASALPADRRFNPLAGHPFVLFQAMKQAGNYRIEELVEAMGTLLDANRKLVGSDLDEAMILQQAALDIIGIPRRRDGGGNQAR